MTDVLISASELAEFIKKEPCVIIDTRNPDAYARRASARCGQRA